MKASRHKQNKSEACACLCGQLHLSASQIQATKHLENSCLVVVNKATYPTCMSTFLEHASTKKPECASYDLKDVDPEGKIANTKGR